MIDPETIQHAIDLGVTGMLFFMLGVLWKGFTDNVNARIKHLEDQNRILLSQVVQQNFRASPAIAPIPPVWNSRTPTTLEQQLET